MRALVLLACVGCGGRLVGEQAPDATLDDATVIRAKDAGTRAADAFLPADAGVVRGADVRCPLRDGGYITCTAPESYCCLLYEGRCATLGSPGTGACVWILCDGRGDCPDGAQCCERGSLDTVYSVACASPEYCREWVPNHHERQVCVPDAADDGCLGGARCTPSGNPLGGFWGLCEP